MSSLPENPRIVVVDNGSTDGTLAHLKKAWPRVKVVGLTSNTGAAARTVGARASATPYIAFCDDDTWWDAGSLVRGIEIFESNPDVAVINAKIIVEPDATLDAACLAMALSGSSEAIGVPIVYFLACAVMFRRSAFLAAGGYHRRFHIGAEEPLLALDIAQAGWTMWYCPQLVLHHAPCATGRRPHEREQLMARNRLWTVWLRHTRGRALVQTFEALQRARVDPVASRAFVEALLGLPWIIRERRPISQRLQNAVDALSEPRIAANAPGR